VDAIVVLEEWKNMVRVGLRARGRKVKRQKIGKQKFE